MLTHSHNTFDLFLSFSNGEKDHHEHLETTIRTSLLIRKDKVSRCVLAIGPLIMGTRE